MEPEPLKKNKELEQLEKITRSRSRSQSSFKKKKQGAGAAKNLPAPQPWFYYLCKSFLVC